MSEYHSQTTKFKDKECLISGLVQAGYDRSVIEDNATPQQLFDYHGRPTKYLDKNGDKAEIIVRRHNIGYGAANDLGFKWNAKTQTYDAIISNYDSADGNWGVSGPRMKNLKKGYGDAIAMKSAKRQGFKYLGKKVVDGKIQLQFMDTRA